MEALKKVEEEVKNDVLARHKMKLEIQRSYDEMVRERQDNGEVTVLPTSSSVPLQKTFNNRLVADSDE